MEVLQYIYTSWKNGNSSEKGYMIYSKSEGITPEECTAIKDAMQYNPPKELNSAYNFAPTPEEIADVFPYSFSYFILPTGRGCIAQSTYLGRDYSGRFGNYIIYAMIFDPAELDCRPAEFFGESCIKTFMTEEELNASSPVPPLPTLSIDEYGSVINDEQLNEFIYDKEEELAQVISMMLKARDLAVPFYLNDTRENLVLWAAALQRVLSPLLAKKFTFNTYMYNQEIMRSARVKEYGLDFCLIGVRPDANDFNYATEYMSNRHLVIDFIGGHMSDTVAPTAFAAAMASSMAMDFEEIDQFGEFVDSTTFSEINSRLEDAYTYYRLLKYDDYDHSDENLKGILAFGSAHCTESDNAEVGGKLLSMIQSNGYSVSAEALKQLMVFISKYASYMMLSVYDVLNETICKIADVAEAPCTDLEALLLELSNDMPDQYKEYLDYLNSPSSVDYLLSYLDGHNSIHTNNFYITWILKNYVLSDLLLGSKPIARLLKSLFKNIGRIDGGEKIIIETLVEASASQTMFESVFNLFASAIQDPKRAERMCACYVELAESLTDTQATRFEQQLIEMPGAMPLATQLFARKISDAKKPDEEFWHFYDIHKLRMMSDVKFSIDPMVFACLNSMDKGKREDLVIEMVRRLDPKMFRDPKTVSMITDTVNELSLKELSKLETSVLQRTCDLRSNISSTGIEKIKAVIIGQKIDSAAAQSRHPVEFSSDIPYKDVTLQYLDKADYELYCKKYFDSYLELINSQNDVSFVMKLFYHRQLFTDFVGDYVIAIKKKEKKEESRCMRMIAWTCIYLATAPMDDPSANALQRPMINYMRSLDEEVLTRVRQEVGMDVPKASCDRLFDEVGRKAGFTEKIGGFFRRK